MGADGIELSERIQTLPEDTRHTCGGAFIYLASRSALRWLVFVWGRGPEQSGDDMNEVGSQLHVRDEVG